MVKQRNLGMIKAAILLIGLQEVGGGAASPALANIMRDFPKIDPSTIMMISTMPYITMMIFSPLYGKIINYVKKRTLMIFSLGLFIISGTLPALMNNIYWILAMRAILGISLGLLYSMTVGLIADFFEGQERATMMGWAQAIGSLGGVFFQTVGGYLAVIDWHYCFYTYLITTLILIFEIIFLPEPEKKVVGSSEKAGLPGNIWWTYLGFMIFGGIILVLVTNMSVLMVNEKIGDAGSAGLALTCMTIGGFLGGTFFGQVYKNLQRWTMTAGYVVSALGYFLIFKAAGTSAIFAGSIIVGLSIGTLISNYFQQISLSVPAAAVSSALAIGVAVQSFGQFVEPYVYNSFLKMLGLSIGRDAYGVAAVILIILAVIYALTAMRKPAESEKAQ